MRRALVASLGLALASLAPTLASAQFAHESPRLEIRRLDARFDALVAKDAAAEKIVAGHVWLEGPTWDAKRGTLFFSDVVANRLWRWTPGGGTDLVLERSGYAGREPFAGPEPGSNGTALDAEGRLLLCEHGDRRVTRLGPDGAKTVLADRYQGRRLNSPNDLFVARNGDLYFTDPPFGLPRAFADPAKELPFQGVYRLRGGALELLVSDLTAPNGVALSPDERTLYVSNADAANPVWMAYPLDVEGRPGPGRVFADARANIGRFAGVPDGMDVDAAGNLWAAGPGALTVFAPDGTRLAELFTGIATSNVAFGGPQGRAAFITASSAVWRVESKMRLAR